MGVRVGWCKGALTLAYVYLTGQSPRKKRIIMANEQVAQAVSPTKAEAKQEQMAFVQTGVALVTATSQQMEIYKMLQSKYRLAKTGEIMAAEGFNQQLKSQLNSALVRVKTLHSDAITYKNEAVAAQCEAQKTELEIALKKLR